MKFEKIGLPQLSLLVEVFNKFGSLFGFRKLLIFCDEWCFWNGPVETHTKINEI